jgi:hypothetical protein
VLGNEIRLHFPPYRLEELGPSRLYSWFDDWMNGQLADISANSNGGAWLPALHFEFIRTHEDVHTSESDRGLHRHDANHVQRDAEGFGSAGWPKPRLHDAADRASAGPGEHRTVSLAGAVLLRDVRRVLLLGVPTSDDHPPRAAALGKILSQGNSRADGYGINRT